MVRKVRSGRAAKRPEDLASALVDAALKTIEQRGVDALTMRDLAFELGVDHREIYRHFKDKDALLSKALEKAWTDYARQLRLACSGQPAGRPMLVAAGLAAYQYGCDHPNLFFFANSNRYGIEGRMPQLEAAQFEAFQVFALGFAGALVPPGEVMWRAVLYLSALYGIVAQTLNRRLRLRPDLARQKIAEACSMLATGLLSDAGPGMDDRDASRFQ